MLSASSRPTNQPANQPMQAYLTSHYFRKKKFQCKPWPRFTLACPPSTRRRCLISCAQSFARITLVKCSYNDTPVLIVKKEKNRSGIPLPCAFYFAHHVYFSILLNFKENVIIDSDFEDRGHIRKHIFHLSSNIFFVCLTFTFRCKRFLWAV